MRVKKKLYAVLAAMSIMVLAAGCGDDSAAAASTTGKLVERITEEPPVRQQETASGESEEEAAKIPEGMYLSELTGEPISEELRNQRPIAVMVDNESKALPHFGTAEADVVYEMMNSTANGRITRLMMMVKDWKQIKQMGSIRSTRPTNIILASEWDAVLCHDGGPFYNDAYFNKGYTPHFSGTFSRVDNGKSREFTEYIVSGDLEKNFKNSKISQEYDSDFNHNGAHFNFAPYGKEIRLEDRYQDVTAATSVKLPFPHNSSVLNYNESTGSYEYGEYGSTHKDGEDGEALAFKNVLLQACDFHQYDDNGYLIYNCVASVQPGYYLTNGKAKLIYWSKESETGLTRYYDQDGKEIEINTGKTYIGLIPADSWNQVEIR